ncbi:flagellar hook-basal body complex protein FliE [uncultured Nocardioides sp.]|uniref:flagellar hook-basal body complex protein FliE n=1 Tax=uncultured Nocardioides sp. TaxID=198441 RepID=UPI0026102BD7|nr:flagellar hook-basal body complex protein FliE [uncultured Nocardioides sp.]
MSIGGIEGIPGVGGFTPFVPPTVPATPAVGGAPSVGGVGGTGGPDFGELVLDGLDRLDGVQRTADQLSVQAATGDLQNIHDYTIAATQAAVTTQVTVAVRNKAVEAFTEIMRMQV